MLTAVAYNFLQTLRTRGDAAFTVPAVRAIVQEVFTLCLFAQRPHYSVQMERLRDEQITDLTKYTNARGSPAAAA